MVDYLKQFSRYLILLFLTALTGLNCYAVQKDWTIHSIEDFNFFYKGDKKECVKLFKPHFKSELYRLQNYINYHLSGKLDILLVESLFDEERLREIHQEYQGNEGGTLMQQVDKIVINIYDQPEEIMRSYRSQLILILIHEMIYGASFQDKVKSANLFYLPDWVLPGISEFISGNWDVESDNKWRLVYEQYGVESFNAIPDEYLALKGASFWKFLTDEYGQGAIPTLLYMTRLTRKFNAALYYSFEKTGNELFREWRNFYNIAYLSDQQKRMPVKGVIFPHGELFELLVPDKQTIYTLEWSFQQYRLYKYKGDQKSALLSLDKGTRPLDKFSGGIQEMNGITYCFSATVRNRFYVYVLKGKKVKRHELEIPSVRRVLQHKGKIYILSSSHTGSKVYEMSITASGMGLRRSEIELKQVSSFDGYVQDFAPVKEGFVLFKTALEKKSHLILQRKNETGSLLERDTLMSGDFQIRQMILSGDSLLYFNCNLNGIYNGMLYHLKANRLLYLTDYRSDILFHEINKNAFAEYISNLSQSILIVTDPLQYDEYFVYDSLKPTSFHMTSSVKNNKVITEDYILTEDSLPSYRFQSPIPSQLDFTISNYDSLKQHAAYLREKSASIGLSPEFYRARKFIFQLYNELPVNADLPFRESVPVYMPNNLGLRIGVNLENQFNNKELELTYYGFRILNNHDIVLGYANTTGIPFSITFLNRQRLNFLSNREIFKDVTNYGSFEWKIAGRKSWSLSNNLAIRHDMMVELSTSIENLDETLVNKLHLMNTLSWNFRLDQSAIAHPQPWRFNINASLQPLYNLRDKLYAVNSLIDVKLSKVLKPWLMANFKARAGNSSGTSPVFFILGGTSSDLFSTYSDRNFSDYKPTALYRMIYGVRGFPVNYRNGNSFGVLTAELKFKLFDVLYKRPVVSEFFDHFTLVAFGDIGSSLYGRNIYDPANALNSTVFDSPGSTLTIEVRNIKNPVIGALGAGIHTRIYSYTIRAEMAYGVEDSGFREPVFHLSLGYGI